jgi:hypothetical protein
MNITEIKNRIAEIGERLGEISRQQAQSGAEFARAQGTGAFGEDNRYTEAELDSLYFEWALTMRTLNYEVWALTGERKALRAQKRALTPCECACH